MISTATQTPRILVATVIISFLIFSELENGWISDFIDFKAFIESMMPYIQFI